MLVFHHGVQLSHQLRLAIRATNQDCIKTHHNETDFADDLMRCWRDIGHWCGLGWPFSTQHAATHAPARFASGGSGHHQCQRSPEFGASPPSPKADFITRRVHWVNKYDFLVIIRAKSWIASPWISVIRLMIFGSHTTPHQAPRAMPSSNNACISADRSIIVTVAPSEASRKNASRPKPPPLHQ